MEDPFRTESTLLFTRQPDIGRTVAIADANGRVLATASTTLRGWKGFLELDLTDNTDRLLLTYRLAPPRPGRVLSIRPLALADGVGRPLGTLQARFDGWRGRRFALLRPDGEYLVVPHVSRFRDDPLMLGRHVVGSVRERGALLSTYTLRFTQPCDHLHAAGLLVFVALRAGRTMAVGN
ncbi:MAG: hypothetical protein L3K00_02430 [Thermoplasmata archaeon]|nr:hypothetical protein [Thermoplasmata archaeon]